MHVLIRRAAVMAGTAAVVLGSAAGIASAGGAPVLAWSAPGITAGTFSYGTVAGGSTTTQTFTLSNSGGSASAVLTVTVTGPAFRLQADTCTGTSLGPRKSCTVTVAYKPGTGGETDTGTLTAGGLKPAASVSVKLTGAVPDIVTVTNPGPQEWTKADSPSLQMTAADSASGQTVTWTATGLPNGLSISPSGAITGTLTAAGTFPVTVTATDGTGASGSGSFTWTVNHVIVTVTSPGPQDSTNGDSITVLVEGDDSAGRDLTWSATGLPDGLKIVPSDGIIGGVLTAAGTFSVTVTATDPVTGDTGSASFTWTVNPVTVTVTSPGPQTSTNGDPITLQIEGDDSSARTVTWSATGLPTGLVISPDGIIGGELTAAGTFSVAVTATDPVTGDTGSATFTWTVNTDVVTVTSPGPQKSTLGVAASLQMTGTDSASLQTLTWSAPDLPAGLSINSATGKITGTPTSPGTFSVTVTATDAVTGTTGSASITWTVGVTVSVTITGGPNTGCGACAVITIDATGLSGSGENTCGSVTSCSLWVHTGDAVDVSVISSIAPFNYTCGSSASQAAAGPGSAGRYMGACQATVTGDYNVTASF